MRISSACFRESYKLIKVRIHVENMEKADVVTVMGRSKFRRYVDERGLLDFMQALRATARFVRTKSKFKIVKEDPDDDEILATACDGDADYIVSGDRHLLVLERFRGIQIVTADRMIQILYAEMV